MIEDVSLGEIHPSPTNPRKTFDDAKLDELAESIRAQGVLQPVLVRPRPSGDGYELVIGERRYRASGRAKLESVPAVVREMTDEEVVEAQIVENQEREDVHPLEEADGYRTLMERFGRSAEEVAAKVGRSKGYVYARMKLCSLGEAGRKAFLEGKLTASTALYVARIPSENLQDQAVKALTEHFAWEDSPVSAREASQVIQSEFMLRLKDAPFATDDADLVPGAGTCNACPKRTGAQPELFSDVEGADVCTDKGCFDQKVNADWKRRADKNRAKGLTVIDDAKEAAKLFAYGDELRHNAPYVSLGDRCWDDPKSRTYRSILGKDAPPKTLLRAPSGKAVEVVARKDLSKVLKEKLPQASGTNTSPGAAADKKRRREQLIRTRAVSRALGRVVDEVQNREPDEGFWRQLTAAILEQAWSDTIERVAQRRGVEGKSRHDRVQALRDLVETGPLAGLRGLAFELTLRDAWPGAYHGAGSSFRRTCERYGVDLKALEKEERAALREKDKAKGQRAKRKAATTKAPKKKGTTKKTTKRKAAAAPREGRS